LPAYAQSWPVGVEREVGAGTYMQVVEENNGWRLWRIEDRSGSTCRAIKSVRGQPHPIPVGSGVSWFRGTPFVSISRGFQNRAAVGIQGRYGYAGKWRQPGDRYWNDELAFADIEPLDGQLIEIYSETFEYPLIFVGHSVETGLLDLTGLSGIIDSLRRCDPDIVFPRPYDPSTPALLNDAIATSADYPSQALRDRSEGITRYRVLVTSQGEGMGCEITESSGDSTLDAETCRQMRRRARFEPARNSDGDPVNGYYEGYVVWELPF